METSSVGLHPEGEAGLWVFRIAMPGIGQIIRGEVTVHPTLADEAVPNDVQKAMALEKVHVLAEMLLKASEVSDLGDNRPIQTVDNPNSFDRSALR